jgi:hypothetical protein
VPLLLRLLATGQKTRKNKTEKDSVNDCEPSPVHWFSSMIFQDRNPYTTFWGQKKSNIDARRLTKELELKDS